jgi:hypothetical protein
MDINIGTCDPNVAENGGITTLKNTAKGIIIAIAVSTDAKVNFFTLIVYTS